jgi:hypothetical protein
LTEDDIYWLDVFGSGESKQFDRGAQPSVACNEYQAIQVHRSPENPGLFSTASLVVDRTRWMAGHVDHETVLRDLVVPLTHDAAMYPPYESPRQEVDFYGQLMAGVRFFDIRAKYRDGVFIAHHGQPGHGDDDADTFRDIFAQFARFYENDRGELSILRIWDYDTDTERKWAPPVYREFCELIVGTLGRFLVRVPCPREKRLADMSLRELMMNGGRLLVALADPCPIPHGVEGLYRYRKMDSDSVADGDLTEYHCFADTENFEQMLADQVLKFANFDGTCTSDHGIPCDLFAFSWTLNGPAFGNQYANSRYVARMQAVPPRNQYGRVVNSFGFDFVEFARAVDVAILRNRVEGRA